MSHPSVSARPRPVRRAVRTRVVALVLLAALLLATISTFAVAQSTNCSNLVADGGFESGSGWQSATNGSYTLLSDFNARSGAKAAQLAGVDGASDQLSIPLALPADKPSVSLSFWWQVQSEEHSGEFDGLSVIAADAAGNPMHSLLTLGSDSTATQWQQSVVDLSAYSGQAIQLKFVAQTDNSLVTDFFIDDVAVTACGAAAYQVFLPVTQR
ncbi:MAG: hypothetical protein DCC55_10730 [Chloroflexi bacterium]|nr:MAG: hypothetical protein DCC55_10730 [Chloroflexota bacterium]